MRHSDATFRGEHENLLKSNTKNLLLKILIIFTIKKIKPFYTTLRKNTKK